MSFAASGTMSANVTAVPTTTTYRIRQQGLAFGATETDASMVIRRKI